jgi:hypothetical protein
MGPVGLLNVVEPLELAGALAGFQISSISATKMWGDTDIVGDMH